MDRFLDRLIDLTLTLLLLVFCAGILVVAVQIARRLLA